MILKIAQKWRLIIFSRKKRQPCGKFSGDIWISTGCNCGETGNWLSGHSALSGPAKEIPRKNLLMFG